ncbi:hypothetical protein BB558_000038 [Smittium angustum]|uniref:Serine hydrolase domain-containing protein n=1 Tax=Smittium angustum TaxID=133377 RepID=A0A2U1JFV4_SMIAN|nr:hypothetical protein BB558_000038 [Smittium angustum]
MRVLYLHGFSQNKYKFKIKTRAINSCFSPEDELVFLDAPIEINSNEDHVFTNYPKTHTEVYPGNEETSRAWWIYESRSNGIIEGFENTMKYLEYMVEKLGPFDGVVGFSQGN